MTFANEVGKATTLFEGTADETTTHYFHFNVTEVVANPDGLFEKKVIGFNNSWPLPVIEVTQGDRVIIFLHNGLPKGYNTSLHFHGLFMEDNNQMDGPEWVTQCPISTGMTYVYNFTVESQVGTYWYHSHSGTQYLDGMRQAFIIKERKSADLKSIDDGYPFEFDEEAVLTISDWYHESHVDLMKKFLNKYNPTGAEPIIQSTLFNDTRNVTFEVKSNTTYFLRIANVAGFVSQSLIFEDHDLTIVEVDGVYVEPVVTKKLYLSAAQRYGVLLKTKEDSSKNYRIMQVVDDEMLDIVPSDLILESVNWLVYDVDAELDYEVYRLNEDDDKFDDFSLTTLDKVSLLDNYDYQIVLNVEMLNLNDGVSYALFNNITYVHPKIPTLATVLSAPDDLVLESSIYGSNTHNFVLQKDEIIEIVINNHDAGKHPFHLHGHVFQVIARSDETNEESYDDEGFIDYDENNHEPFPDYPMMRDTVQVPGNGYMVIRFMASNPGVWFFHCHVDWHLEQGLAITLIEDPISIRERQQLTDNFKSICDAIDVPYFGNAAGNGGDKFGDLTGENVQPGFLPEGFTLRGYIAFVVCCIVGIFGLKNVYDFGKDDEEVDNNTSYQVITNLKNILIQNGAFDEFEEEGVTLTDADSSSGLLAHDGSSLTDDISAPLLN